MFWPTLNEFYEFQALRLVEYACMVLASHGPGHDAPDACEVCHIPWRCPLVTWAADWILTVGRLGLVA